MMNKNYLFKSIFVPVLEYQTSTPDYLKCPYGKYFNDIGKPPTCNPFAKSCPPGFYCGAGPADQPGFCCKCKCL